MEKKKTSKKKVVVVPKDRVEMEQFVARIREVAEKLKALSAEIAGDLAVIAARVNDVKKDAQTRAKPLEERIDGLAQGVFIFASDHRSELTDEDRKKTVELVTGDKIRWYLPPSSVVVADEDEAIAELERRGLGEFIRVKKEINKEAILQNPEKIAKLKHLSVSQVEIFAIVPDMMDFELQKGDRKFKKVKLS